MTCVKTFTTTFEPICKKLRLANECGGFTIYQGELVRIVSFAELEAGGVLVDMVPATFPDVAPVHIPGAHVAA